MFCKYCLQDKNQMETKYKCVQCHKLYQKSYRTENGKRLYHSGTRTPAGRYTKLKYQCKERGLNLMMTLEEFDLISAGICYYCKGELDTDKGEGSKLDRLDNSIGYAASNCVCCCGFCNKIKQDLLTPEENIAAIAAIISVRRRNKSESSEYAPRIQQTA